MIYSTLCLIGIGDTVRWDINKWILEEHVRVRKEAWLWIVEQWKTLLLFPAEKAPSHFLIEAGQAIGDNPSVKLGDLCK
jgi:hypothetical protein